jgi:hypothetical protein
MLIECKICGELCKDDIGLRNHVTKKKDHPKMSEYRERYMSGKPYKDIKFDYIIPVANINDDGFTYRLKNLNNILRIIPDFVHVVLVEQMLNPVYSLYSNNLESFPNLNITKKIVKFHTFNKGWLYNIGVKNSVTDNIILAEGDIHVNRQYFVRLKKFILKKKHLWFFAWNKIIYWNNDFSEKLREDTPRETMAEGGLVYFNKIFYWEIGGSNEFFQELGGIDNELATRARFTVGEDKLFEGTINHLWHPVSYLKKDNWKFGRHYVKNRILYYQVKDNPKLAIDSLRKLNIGRTISPVDDESKERFLKVLNIKKIPSKRGYR